MIVLKIIFLCIIGIAAIIIAIKKATNPERRFLKRKILSEESFTALESRLNKISYGKDHKTRQDDERAYLLSSTLKSRYRLRANQADTIIALFHYIDGVEKARRIIQQPYILRDEIDTLEKKKIGEMLFGGKKKDE